MHLKNLNCVLRQFQPIFYQTQRNIDVLSPPPQHNNPDIKKRIFAVKSLPEHLKLWKDELEKRFAKSFEFLSDKHGNTDIIYDFKNDDSLKHWMTKSDMDFDGGYSMCNLIRTPIKTGLFYGYTNTTIPKDGRFKYAGFCTMKTVHRIRSLYRDNPLNITYGSHFVLRVRGDGRMYSFHVCTPGYFDTMRHDQYVYPICTRGGPYWHLIKIPFSKLAFSYKGRIQDRQERINNFSPQAFIINVNDGVDGPFKLEIDYIAMYHDAYHTEEFAYETYRVPVEAGFS